MKKRINSKIWKRISAMFILPSVFLSSVAIGISVGYSKSQPTKEYKIVTPTFGTPTFGFLAPGGYPAPIPLLKAGTTPETLLTLPALDIQNGKPENQQKFKAIVASLKNQAWRTTKVDNIYLQAISAIMTEQSLAGLFPANTTAAAAGRQKFNDVGEVNDITRELNQFKNISKTTKLQIVRPTHTYQYFDAYKGLSAAEVAMSNDFSYKVAELNLDPNNGDQIDDDKSVVYKFKDNADPNAANHDYSLIFNNEHNQIVDGLKPATGSATKNIQNLIDSRDIFIRDESTKQLYNFPGNANQGATPIDFIKIKFNQTSGKIEVFVNPKAKNKKVGQSSIDFWIAQGTTPKGKRYGILDNSLSPLHLTKATQAGQGITPNLTNWNLNPVNATKKMTAGASNMGAYKLYSDWKEEAAFQYKNAPMDPTNHLRLFMAKGAGKLEFALRFNGKGADAFNNSDNKIIVKFDETGQIDRPRSSLQITRQVWGQQTRTVQPFGISINPIPNNNPNWLQIDIFAQKGVIALNPKLSDPTKEESFRIKKASSKIFFEPPIGATIPDGKVDNPDIVNIEQQQKQGQFNKQIVSNLFGNWSNPTAAKKTLSKSGWLLLENNKWFKSKNNLIATPGGSPLFSINHDIWEKPTNKGFIKHGAKDTMLGNTNKITGNKAKKTLIEQDPATGAPIKETSGDFKTMVSTGSNIVKVLETISKLYYDWIQKFDQNRKNIAPRDSFLVPDITQISGLVQKQIIQQSGTKGQMANDIVAGILAKEFGGTGNATTKLQDDWQKAFEQWEAGNYSSLSKTQKKILEPLVDAYGENAPWFGLMSLNQIHGLNAKPKAGGTINTQSVAYKQALQYMMWVTAPYLADAIQQIFKNQEDAFAVAKSSVIGKSMAAALTQKSSSNNISAITSSAIKKVPDSSLPSYLKGIGLQEMSGSPLYKVNSIKLALASLIKFIYDTKLQKRFLTAVQAKTFDDLYKNGLLTDPKVYNDSQRQQDIVAAVKVLDEVIKQVLNNHSTGAKTFTEIIDDLITAKQSDPKQTKAELINSISKTLDIIASPSQAYEYKYFGGKAYSTFVQNLIMGKNVQLIVIKWKQDKIAKKQKFNSSIIAELLKNDTAYKPAELTRLAINTGTYNLDYFIKSFTTKGYVAEAATSLYNADIQTAISFELPKGGSLVELIGNPESFAKYIYGIIGLIILSTGIFALVLSFRKSISGVQKKTTIAIMRGAFSFMVVGGISLICFTILTVL